MHRVSPSRLLLAGLLLVSVVPALAKPVDAETRSVYFWATVHPTIPGPSFIIHSSVGHNWTASFQAIWTYGNNSGQAIKNATVPVEVRTADDAIVETLLSKTNATGVISFYYYSSTPDVLTFAPTKLVTEDGMEWNSSLFGDGQDYYLYGFRSDSTTIYWDTFDISLIGTYTNTRGTTVLVNISYLLVPQEGLTALQPPDYLQYDYIPKYVHGADVKINDIKAQESWTQGEYSAQTFTLLPIEYILVEVSQEGWAQTKDAFSFTHVGIETIWVPATTFGFVGVAVILMFHFVSSKKAKDQAFVKRTVFPTVGAILLVIASFISVYWVLVGVESILHGFDWILLGILGVVAFAFGLAGSLMSKTRKNFAFTLIAVCFPLLENAILVKLSFDNYQLPTPWIAVAPAIITSTLSGILIGRSDAEFS